MLKKVVIIVVLVILFTGCDKMGNPNDGKEKIYLTQKYYNNGEFLTIDIEKLDLLDNETFVIFTYNTYCTIGVSCEDVFKSFMEKYRIDFYKIPFVEFKNSKYYEVVKYAPSIVIIQNGKVFAYLDANSEADHDAYKDVSIFESWFDKYIYFNI